MCFPSGFGPRGLQLPDSDDKRQRETLTAGSTLPFLSLSSHSPVCFPPSHGPSVPCRPPEGKPPIFTRESTRPPGPLPESEQLGVLFSVFYAQTSGLEPPRLNSSALDQVVHRKRSRCPRRFPADPGVTITCLSGHKRRKGCETMSPFTAKPRVVTSQETEHFHVVSFAFVAAYYY